jgi:hypothetical protein
MFCIDSCDKRTGANIGILNQGCEPPIRAICQVLTVVLLNIQFLWDVTPCRLVSGSRSFKGTLFLHIHRSSSLFLPQ